MPWRKPTATLVPHAGVDERTARLVPPRPCRRPPAAVPTRPRSAPPRPRPRAPGCRPPPSRRSRPRSARRSRQSGVLRRRPHVEADRRRQSRRRRPEQRQRLHEASRGHRTRRRRPRPAWRRAASVAHPHDAGVGVRRPQEGRVQQPRQHRRHQRTAPHPEATADPLAAPPPPRNTSRPSASVSRRLKKVQMRGGARSRARGVLPVRRARG